MLFLQALSFSWLQPNQSLLKRFLYSPVKAGYFLFNLSKNFLRINRKILRNLRERKKTIITAVFYFTRFLEIQRKLGEIR